MADKIDKILQSYFSGDMVKDIDARKEFINVRNQVEDEVIESDPQLLVMQHHLNICKMWTNDLPNTRFKVLSGIYTKKISWIKAADTYNVSISTIRDWRNLLKNQIAPWLFISSNKENQ